MYNSGVIITREQNEVELINRLLTGKTNIYIYKNVRNCFVKNTLHEGTV